MHDKRTKRIHLAASVLPPLALLISAGYTIMYRPLGKTGRWLIPLLCLAFFVAGYYIMRLQERIFGYARVDFDVDDGYSETTRQYVRKRYLIAPALLAAIPAGMIFPLIEKEIVRLVREGQLEYMDDDFIAPWLVFGFIVLAAVLGASARMKPGNIALSKFAVLFHAICHAALFIINIFMEVPSVLPTALCAVVMVVALFELNTAFVEDICRKTRDDTNLPTMRETNYQYVKRIVKNFFWVFIVPFLLTSAFSVVWQYLLENRLNQPL